MSVDYSILKKIAENSGRQSYITNGKFRLLWTNSDVIFTEILLQTGEFDLDKHLEKETIFSCVDGSALKITPIIENGIVQLYFFERYASSELVGMIAKTSVFKNFSKQYTDSRDKLHTYVNEVFGTTLNESVKGDYFAESVNLAAICRILEIDELPIKADINNLLNRIFSNLKILSCRITNLKVEFNVEEQLFTMVNAASLEFAIANLFSNAYIHNSSIRKQIKINAYHSNGFIVIEVSDNGTNADTEKINKFRNIYETQSETYGEGLGIALVQIFVNKYGGQLEFSNTKSGGLSAKILLPDLEADKPEYFFANDCTDSDYMLTYDILKKGFPARVVNSVSPLRLK